MINYNLFENDPYENLKQELLTTTHMDGDFYYWSKKIIELTFSKTDQVPQNLLNASHGQYKLSLLHIAAISTNSVALNTLLEQGANPNAQDHRGWTPLHHLALTKHNILAMRISLIGKGADKTLKNDLYATAKKLKMLISPNLGSGSPCYWLSEKSNTLKPCSSEEYCKLTGSKYILENFVTSEYLIKEWSQPKQPLLGLFPFTKEIMDQYTSYTTNPPSHILKVVNEDSEGNKLPTSLGLGLYSHGIFQKHKIVGEYKGMIFEKQKEGIYVISNGCDAESYSSPETRINSSFPNVSVMHLPAAEGIEGLPYRLVFVSLEDIEGQFCWNYGGHHTLKLGPYIEQRPKEMRDFIRNNNIDELFLSMVMQLGDLCEDWKCYAEGEKLRYILQTPSALFLLTLEGILPIDRSQKFLQFALNSEILIKNNDTKKCVSVAAELHLICQKIGQIKPEIVTDIESTFQKLAAKVPLKELLEIAISATEQLAEEDYLANWEKIKQKYCSQASSFNLEPENLQKKSRPEIVVNSDGRCAITGIGKKLDVNDIGKKFVRTYPHLDVDWSYIPGQNDIESVAKKLIGVEENFLIFYSSPHIPRLKLNMVDDNWLEADLYEAARTAVLETTKPEERNCEFNFPPEVIEDELFSRENDFL